MCVIFFSNKIPGNNNQKITKKKRILLSGIFFFGSESSFVFLMVFFFYSEVDKLIGRFSDKKKEKVFILYRFCILLYTYIS